MNFSDFIEEKNVKLFIIFKCTYLDNMFCLFSEHI